MIRTDLYGYGTEGLHSVARRWVLATLMVLVVLVLAIAPALATNAAISAKGTGLPDGNRASGIYTVDGGYGLAESFYADLVASLLSR